MLNYCSEHDESYDGVCCPKCHKTFSSMPNETRKAWKEVELTFYATGAEYKITRLKKAPKGFGLFTKLRRTYKPTESSANRMNKILDEHREDDMEDFYINIVGVPWIEFTYQEF